MSKSKKRYICSYLLLILFCLLFCSQNSVKATEEMGEKTVLKQGMSYYYQKKWDKAIDSFQLELNKRPYNSLALVYYIMSNIHKGTLDEMISELEDSFIQNPKDIKTQTYLGFAYYAQSLAKKKKELRDEALLELREVARKEKLACALTGLGIIYLDNGMTSRAKREFLRAIEADPEDILAYEFLGQIFLQEEKKPENAQKYFLKIVEILPVYPDGHYLLAKAFEDSGNLFEAKKEYQKTIELDPLGIGKGLVAKKKFEEIKKILEDKAKKN